MSNCARNQKAKLAADYNDLLKELASPKLKSVGCYTLGETIGRGSYGKVKLGVHQLTCRFVAIKKINKRHAPVVSREIHHHRQLSHPNIVSLYEILTTEKNIFIVSEHCPHGDLFDALAKNKRFSEQHTKVWFLQLLDAMQYCHSLGIIHRDLKLENILLDENDQVKICDFGFARQTDKNQLLKTFCGSLAYSAPEVIQRQKYSGPATDVWSLGIILYTLLAGELPFDDDCESILQRKVVKMEYNIPSFFTPQVNDLVHNILKLDPYDRLTIQQIKQHCWLGQFESTQAPLSIVRDEKREHFTASALKSAGFHKSVVDKMKKSYGSVGMLGTLWTMLLSSHNNNHDAVSCATQTDENATWIGSFRSWFQSSYATKESKPSATQLLSERPAHLNIVNCMTKLTTTLPPITSEMTTRPDIVVRPPALKSLSVSQLTPVYSTSKEELLLDQMINTSSTCSSSTTLDDEFDEDDHSSLNSSPATSVAEEEEDDEGIKSDCDNVLEFKGGNITAFHKVSPMPSRIDILLPWSRHLLDEPRSNNNNRIRNRLENKTIVEDEEEDAI